MSAGDVEVLLGDARPWGEHVGVGRRAAELVCAGASDQEFLDLVVAAAAGGLVTGDGHLLALRDDAPFDIVELSVFTERAYPS